MFEAWTWWWALGVEDSLASDCYDRGKERETFRSTRTLQLSEEVCPVLDRLPDMKIIVQDCVSMRDDFLYDLQVLQLHDALRGRPMEKNHSTWFRILLAVPHALADHTEHQVHEWILWAEEPSLGDDRAELSFMITGHCASANNLLRIHKASGSWNEYWRVIQLLTQNTLEELHDFLHLGGFVVRLLHASKGDCDA